MAKSDFLSNLVLDIPLGQGGSLPTELYLGFSSTLPTAAGTNVTEPSGNGYARVALSTYFGAAATGATSNDVLIESPTSTGAWLTGTALPYVVMFDASTAGNLCRYNTTAMSPAPVIDGASQKIQIPVGDLDLTEA